MINQIFWRAEVYTASEVELGKAVTLKLYAGLYDSRLKAEEAAQRKCRRVKGFGFYVHRADTTRLTPTLSANQRGRNTHLAYCSSAD